MIRRGAPWEGPATPADTAAAVLVAGDDAALAAAASTWPGRPVRFEPSPGSDLARSIGSVGPLDGGEHLLPLDLVAVAGHGLAVNAVVLGPRPDRVRPWQRRVGFRLSIDGGEDQVVAGTSVVVANGQFLAGCDAVPRAHPGDGWLDVQVYDVPRPQRAPLRRRLASGAHLPHPGIRQCRARRVEIVVSLPVGLEIDGRRRGRIETAAVVVQPAALRLIVGASAHA